MRILKPSYQIETEIDGMAILKKIERAGRTCYKSEDKITEDSALAFIKKILDPTRRHESVIEHESISVRFICDRGITHEIVRHRLASYSQESTRYCNYSKAKHDEQITVIDIEPHCTPEQFDIWMEAQQASEAFYFRMIKAGAKPQIARSVLMNGLKTEIVMTANLREWRHFFNMRAAKPAHPQMRELACPLLRDFRSLVPVVFDDVGDPEADALTS